MLVVRRRVSLISHTRLHNFGLHTCLPSLDICDQHAAQSDSEETFDSQHLMHRQCSIYFIQINCFYKFPFRVSGSVRIVNCHRSFLVYIFFLPIKRVDLEGTNQFSQVWEEFSSVVLFPKTASPLLQSFDGVSVYSEILHFVYLDLNIPFSKHQNVQASISPKSARREN